MKVLLAPVRSARRTDDQGRSPLHIAVTWVVTLMLVVLVSVAGYAGFVALQRERPVTLPVPMGPYHVGRATFDWTDHSRVDPVAARPGHRRELSVWLWYPTAPDSAGLPAPYAPGAWRQLHVSGPAGLFEGSFAAVRDHALNRPPPAPGRFPVVMLEPGLGFAAPQYTALAEDLASHGYLVAGVTPTYSANLSVLHDHAISATAAGNPANLGSHLGQAGAEADRLLKLWAEDAHFVATTVAGLDRAGPFAGRVQHDQLAYIGHSFGGAAALQACHTDPRCRGAVDLDGTQFGTVVQAGLHAPLLILGSEGSCVTGTCRVRTADDQADRNAAQSLLAASSGPSWCYQINGAQHFNFTDDAVLYLAPPLRSLYALGPIDGDRGLQVQTAYVVAFLDQNLRQTPQPLLSGHDRRYPEAVRTGQEPDLCDDLTGSGPAEKQPEQVRTPTAGSG